MSKREIERSRMQDAHTDNDVASHEVRTPPPSLSAPKMVMNWRIKFARWLHRKMFRKHGPFVDYFRQLLWFANRNRKSVGLPLVLFVVASAFSIYSLFVDFPTIQSLTFGTLWQLLTSKAVLAGVAALFLGLFAMVVQWRLLVKQADSLEHEEVLNPVDYEYLPPYSDWRNTQIGNSGGWRHDDQLDHWLFGRPTISLKNRKPRWTPVDDETRRMRTLWGGQSFVFNEWKIRLASDLYYDVEQIEVQKTDYASSMVTNHLGLWKLIVDDQPAVGLERTGLKTGKIPRLAESDCSNHIGGDLLVVGPGILWLTLTSRRSDVEASRYHCSASGSFDWDSDRKGQEDLLSLIETGLRRELTEEARFAEEAANDGEFRVVRYGRATYAGGKPQFLALCRYPKRNPGRSGERDVYTAKVQEVEFPTDAGIRGLVEALDKFRAGTDDEGELPFSRPLTMCVELLRELADGEGNQEVASWLTKYWNRPRSLHIVPVGHSLLDFVKAHENSAVQHALAIGNTAVGDDTRSHLVACADAATGFSSFEQLRPGILSNTSALRNAPGACAEWASVRLEGRHHEDHPGDRTVVLLASGATEGLQAAVGVATRYASKNGYYYIDSRKGVPLDRFESGNVYLCRTPGLKPSTDLPPRAIAYLKQIGRAITDTAVRAHADDISGRIVFHLNVDYSDMDTFLLDVAQETKSALERQAVTGWSVSVVKVHESRASSSDDHDKWVLGSLPFGC